MRLGSILTVALFASLSAGSFGCNRVRVDDVRGPDGNDWKRVSCRHMDQRCFKTAAVMCPSGYYFTRADAPGAVHEAPAPAASSDSDDDGATASAPAAAAPPEVGKNAKPLPPQNQWDRGMYSHKRGTILVKCAAATARAD